MNKRTSSSSTNISKSSKSKSNTELKLTGIGRSLWLVRIPTFVSEICNNANDRDEIGKMYFTKSNNPQNPKKINIEISNPTLGEKPIHFDLEDIGKNTLMENDILSFVQEEDSHQYSLVGTCTKSFVLKPKDTPEYHELRKKRKAMEQSHHGKETTSMSLSDLASKAYDTSTYILNLGDNSGAASSSSSSKKSTEIDVSLIRSRLLSRFASDNKQLWDDLVMACQDVPGVTKANIRSILENYATFHSKGQFRQYWELKPEYRDHSKQR